MAHPIGLRGGRAELENDRGRMRHAMRQTFVIVGGGLTAGAAASTLRGEGFDGEIVLIGYEAHPPYERPPLSKEYLRGEQPFEKGYLLPPEWYEQNSVRLMLGRKVERVDVAARAVHVAG